MNIITSLGLKKIFRMKKAHDVALRYVRGYMVSECIRALSNTGILEQLLENKDFDVELYARNKNLDEKILKALFDYFYSLKILDKDNKVHRASKIGRFIFNYTKGAFGFANAYSPVFDNLEVLLKKEKRYGLDIKRIDSLVAKASAETEEWMPYPIVKKFIRKYRFKNVLDLGCGNAHFLIKLCEENSDVRGYGIDISSEALEDAKKKLNSSAAKERIELSQCDIFQINGPAKVGAQKIDVIISMFVFHEFVGNDTIKIIDMLKQLKRDFKDSYIVICELCKKTPKELRDNPTLIAEHHLFHALSNQNLLSYEDWEDIFKQTHHNIVEEIKVGFAGQGYFILK